MNERRTIAWGAVMGAAIGAAAGFVLFTERGRRLRRDIQPELEAIGRGAADLASSLGKLRTGTLAETVTGARPGPHTPPRRA